MTGELATVFGGSGFIGRNVVRELAKRGWRVRVGVRKPHLAAFLKPMGDVGQIQIVEVDILDRASIARSLEGAHAAVNLVGVLYQRGRYGFRAMHEIGAQNIAEMAAKEGVKAMAHLSAIGADAAAPALYAQSKAAGEAAVRRAFPDAVILRPSIVFGPKDGFFNRFAQMARLSPALPSIGFGRTKFQPVYVDDVADAVAEVLKRTDSRSQTYELGGPSVYSFNELMRIMLDVIERRRILAPIPFPIATAIGFGGQIAGRFLPSGPPLTVDQVQLLKRNNVVGASGEAGAKTFADLGITPQAVEAILPTYLERFRKYGQFEPNRVG